MKMPHEAARRSALAFGGYLVSLSADLWREDRHQHDRQSCAAPCHLDGPQHPPGHREPLAGLESQDLIFGIVDTGGIGRATAGLAAALGFRAIE